MYMSVSSDDHSQRPDQQKTAASWQMMGAGWLQDFEK
jgi:hypothetical protein